MSTITLRMIGGPHDGRLYAFDGRRPGVCFPVATDYRASDHCPELIATPHAIAVFTYSRRAIHCGGAVVEVLAPEGMAAVDVLKRLLQNYRPPHDFGELHE